MKQTLTIKDFFDRFPNDDACLDHLMKVRYGTEIVCPKCKKHGKFHKIKKMPAYSCQWCGNHVHPMVGTPFEKSRTPLQKWFYAMYLFTTSRHGVPAKELQRQLGVTYKCAWRMAHQIRTYMGKVDGDEPLDGHVEVDETLIGPKGVKGGKRGMQSDTKTIVMGLVERNGLIKTQIIGGVRRDDLLPVIQDTVVKGATITTDELKSYKKLKDSGYTHGSVSHSTGQYVRGIHHTNTIEGFWSHLKKAIRGTHIHVSAKHLKKYLGEFEYRYNMREVPMLMFDRLLASF